MNGMPDLLPSVCLLTIFFTGYFIQQITGFGAAIFCLPFSLLLLPREVFMPATWLFTGVQALVILLSRREKVNVKQLTIVLVLASVFGTMTSSYLLMHVSESITKICLGIFIVLNSLYELYVIRKGEKRKGLKLWHYVYPVGSGALQSSYGVGGPLLVAYLSKVIEDKDEMRSTICGYWVFLNTFLLCKHIISGQVTILSVRICLMLIPAVIAGCTIGNLILKRINQKTFLIAVHCVLIISAMLMVI